MEASGLILKYAHDARAKAASSRHIRHTTPGADLNARFWERDAARSDRTAERLTRVANWMMELCNVSS